MLNNLQKLHITLDNICELNHFVHTHSLKNNTVGKEYTTMSFHGEEPNAESDPWHYKINKFGYRGENWSFDRQSIPFFGCSFTFGTGVEADIATAVSLATGKTCHNLGQPGASAISILKTFVAFNKLHSTDVAIVTLPQLERVYYPTFLSNLNVWTYSSLIPHWKSKENEKVHNHAYNFFKDSTSAAYLYDYIKMAELSAEVNNTTIIWSSWDKITEQFLREVTESKRIVQVGDARLDLARDGLHPGPKFVDHWKSNITLALQDTF